MNDSSDDRWIHALVTQQSNREKLFGDSMNPRITQVKKHQKRCHEALFQSSCNMDKFFRKTEEYHPSPPNQIVCTPAPTIVNTPSSYSFLTENQHKKKKKGNKKRKKYHKQAQLFLSENLLNSENKSGNLMAEVIKTSQDLIMVDNELFIYQEDKGYYKKSSYRELAREMRSLLDYEDQLKVTSRQYKESYEQLLISEELECEEGFFENKPYVNCLNGVVDVARGVLLEHSPDYRFKHCINANYIPGEGKCELFLEYLEHITNGDKDLKRLIRVILGYIFSHYFNGKKAFLIYGIPHCGKSVFCAVIEKIMGSEYTSHVDLSKLQKQEYAASLSGKLMNIASDLRNESLSDVGFFKSLVSRDDTISARMLYDNPKDIKCEARMLFSTNHLLTFDSSLDIYDIEAVFNRLIYIPYQNKPISQAQDNKHLSDDLFGERDLIFTWSMKGLRDYIDNNENFPYSKLSEDIKRVNMSRYCAEKVFFEDCLKKADGLYESSSSIKEAFASFCVNNGVNRKADIGRFLDEHQRIPKSKKRIDDEGNPTSSGNPIYVYEGIRLKNKYR